LEVFDEKIEESEELGSNMRINDQTELFDNDSPTSEEMAGTLNQVHWSFSRRETLERCPRQYYYEYFGSKKSTNRDELLRQKVAQFKQIQNRHLRTGEILHLIIKTYFGKLRKGERWELSRLLSWAKDMIQKDREFSRNPTTLQSPPESKFPPTLLLEYYYQIPNREALWDKSEEKLSRSLTNFMNSSSYDEFRQRAANENAKIEHRFRYEISQGIKVSGQIDLMDVQNEDAIIVDWKSGQGSGENESLQLLTYSMWLKDEFHVSADHTRIYQVNLYEDITNCYVVTESKLSRARMRILQDAERMEAIEKHGITGAEEAFTPCGQLKLCRLCSFQEICPKE
jgi:RecB family exonuclease